MMAATRHEFGQIDVLVLNASGGLKKAQSSEYAMQLNLFAQMSIVDAALPLIPRSGRIIFVTSHMVHFYAERGSLGPYEPVVASKYAGEQALLKRRPKFDKLEISLGIVNGDMIEGAITLKLLDRVDRGTIQARRTQAGALPTVSKFDRAIADAATNNEPPEQTIYVGITD